MNKIKIYRCVKKAIDKNDLYGLLSLPNAAPDDEYDIESEAIALKINEKSDVNEIAEVIDKVFKDYFNKNFSKEDILKTANNIKQNLNHFSRIL